MDFQPPSPEEGHGIEKFLGFESPNPTLLAMTDYDVAKLPPVFYEEFVAVQEAGEFTPWHIADFGIERFGERRGEGVLVGVVGTGCDRIHRTTGDLAGRVRNCQDFTGTSLGGVDDNGHETGVGAVISAVWGNRVGTRGMSLATLDFVKVMDRYGSGRDAQIAAGIDCCVTQWHNHILNLSFGARGRLPLTEAAILRAVAAGVTVIVAAGNDGDGARCWPAMMDEVISVAAVDRSRNPVMFSSPSSVDVAAPGKEIFTAWLNGEYQVVSGTSFAAPWMTGWFAIWFAEFHQATGRYPTPAESAKQIEAWSVDVGLPGDDAKVGHGIVSYERYMAAREASNPTTVTVQAKKATFGQMVVQRADGDEFSLSYTKVA